MIKFPLEYWQLQTTTIISYSLFNCKITNFSLPYVCSYMQHAYPWYDMYYMQFIINWYQSFVHKFSEAYTMAQPVGSIQGVFTGGF